MKPTAKQMAEHRRVLAASAQGNKNRGNKKVLGAPTAKQMAEHRRVLAASARREEYLAETEAQRYEYRKDRQARKELRDSAKLKKNVERNEKHIAALKTHRKHIKSNFKTDERYSRPRRSRLAAQAARSKDEWIDTLPEGIRAKRILRHNEMGIIVANNLSSWHAPMLGGVYEMFSKQSTTYMELNRYQYWNLGDGCGHNGLSKKEDALKQLNLRDELNGKTHRAIKTAKLTGAISYKFMPHFVYGSIIKVIDNTTGKVFTIGEARLINNTKNCAWSFYGDPNTQVHEWLVDKQMK